MLLHFGKILWQETDRKTNTTPKLDQDIKTDVLIVGAGMSGNLTKYQTLKFAFNKTIHGINIDIEYSWNALFATSKDNLPFLGKDPKHKNYYYVLAYEGNDTCYSLAGATIIADLIRGIDNPCSHIVHIDPQAKPYTSALIAYQYQQ